MSNQSSTSNHDSDPDEYSIPLQDQRVFGAGLKRKRIHFVPSSATSTPVTTPQSHPGFSVAERYLSLVLPVSKDTEASDTEDGTGKEVADQEICETCNLPLTSKDGERTQDTGAGGEAANARRQKKYIHEATLPHQICLPHSHPPSSLSRTRLGLKILSSQGWDPDSRTGLGREGEGVRFPVKVREKDDKLGVGVVVPKEVGNATGAEVAAKARVLGGREKGIKRLDAKEVRRKAERERREGERLREVFYGTEDVERYLRG